MKKLFNRNSNRNTDWSFLVAVLICLVGSVLLGIATFSVHRHHVLEIEDEGERSFSKAESVLKLKVNGYLHGLQGLAGVYTVTGYKPSSKQIRTYAESRQLFENFPGVLGFGFIRYVRSRDRSAQDSLLIESIEPIEKNQKVLGSDIASEKVLREAALKAVETGNPVFSENVPRVQTGKNESVSLFFLPVYKTGVVPATLEGRRENIVGLTYAPVLGSENAFSVPHPAHGLRSLILYGREWVLGEDVDSGTRYALLKSYPLLIFILGSMILTGVVFWARKEICARRHAVETELEQAMAALNRSAIVATTDLQGKILQVNDKFTEVSGYSREELIGKDHRIVNSGMHSKEFFKDLWSTISSGQSWTGEIQNRKKNGEFYWVQTVISPLLNNQHQIHRYIAVRFETTDRKRAEETLSQSAKLASLAKMAALGEMAGGIAHEINNPLTIIQGKARQLSKVLDQGAIELPKLKEGLERIESTAMRIAKIINGLRFFSRNSDKDAPEIVPVSKIVEDTLALCKERFTDGGVQLRVSVPTDVAVECRAVQISQVILNLLCNSYDAVECLPEKWVELAAISENGVFTLTVTDSGSGISKKEVDRIMEPFFSTKGVGKGTGLGLSIAKGIMEEHHGSLEYDASSPHTRFVLRLPLFQPKAVASASKLA